MSTASEDLSPDQPQRTSHQPGPLAVLAATAIGGVLATRMGKASLLFAVGAAAMAMLKQKKHIPPPPPATPKSLPPPEVPAQTQVEQWLSRQIIREEQVPVIDFSKASATPSQPDDDYRPGSFLLDDFDELSSAPPLDNEIFACLADPAPQPELIPAPAPEIEVVDAEQEPEAPPPPPILRQEPPPPTSPPVPAYGAWTLGVDPLPSLNESASYLPPAAAMFFSTPVPQQASGASREAQRSHSQMFSTAPAPVQHEEPAPLPFFATPVFQGAAFPDEIQVVPPWPPTAPMASPAPSIETPVWQPAPMLEPLPTAIAAPEILTSPAEASFDPPLAAAPHNPWQPEPDVFAATPAVTFQPQPAASTVVEAEIILRPRAPMQNSVPVKSKFAPPVFASQISSEDSSAPPAEGTSDAHLPGPLPSPHDPKPRPGWLSWWRGD